MILGLDWNCLLNITISYPQFNLSAKQLGLFFLLLSAVYAVSSPFWGWLADKLVRTWIMMVVGLLISGGGLVLLGPSPFLPFAK